MRLLYETCSATGGPLNAVGLATAAGAALAAADGDAPAAGDAATAAADGATAAAEGAAAGALVGAATWAGGGVAAGLQAATIRPTATVSQNGTSRISERAVE